MNYKLITKAIETAILESLLMTGITILLIAIMIIAFLALLINYLWAWIIIITLAASYWIYRVYKNLTN